MSRYINLDEAADLFRGIDATMAGSFVADTLESLPTIEPSEDAVCCRELLSELAEYYNNSDMPEYWHHGVADAIEIVRSFPSVIPKPKEGEWIYKGNSIEPIWNCSECGKQIICSQSELPNYCEDCGARMKDESNDLSEDFEKIVSRDMTEACEEYEEEE